MGDVGSARYEPALLPPCPTIKVLSNSNFQRSTHSIFSFQYLLQYIFQLSSKAYSLLIPLSDINMRSYFAAS